MMVRSPKEFDLKTELKKAMERLESKGISYPEGYYEKLLDKYSKEGVDYPRTLMRIGEPNIEKHPCYEEIVKKKGNFLDYGCGTGDDIRTLIEHGYPKNKIRGFDIKPGCIDLGFDLYMDKIKMEKFFVVSPEFSFNGFDAVYSGSVLHTFESADNVSEYMLNAYNALRNGGVLFGSTMGTDDRSAVSFDGDTPPMLLTEGELLHFLEDAGFEGIEISSENVAFPYNPMYRFWFSGAKR